MMVHLLFLDYHYLNLIYTLELFLLRTLNEEENLVILYLEKNFILAPPSIQNPVAISSSAGTIPATINVQDTTYFPNEGYLFTTGGTVIQYTGKTTTSFTGCTLTRGTNSIANGHELIPFVIT